MGKYGNILPPHGMQPERGAMAMGLSMAMTFALVGAATISTQLNNKRLRSIRTSITSLKAKQIASITERLATSLFDANSIQLRVTQTSANQEDIELELVSSGFLGSSQSSSTNFSSNQNSSRTNLITQSGRLKIDVPDSTCVYGSIACRNTRPDQRKVTVEAEFTGVTTRNSVDFATVNFYVRKPSGQTVLIGTKVIPATVVR